MAGINQRLDLWYYRRPGCPNPYLHGRVYVTYAAHLPHIVSVSWVVLHVYSATSTAIRLLMKIFRLLWASLQTTSKVHRLSDITNSVT